ncbi:MAG: dolichol kinase [Haloferacaceae archaeon]
MSELQRRAVHASGAVVPLAYLAGLVDWPTLQWLFVVGSVGVIVLETLRLSVGLDWTIYDRLTREYEADNPAGYALYVLSSAAVALVFSPHVAVPGLLMLSIGDPISGLLASRGVEEGKSLPVLATMFAVCLGVALPVLVPAVGVARGVAAGAAGAAGATVADGLKPVVAGYVIDDNLSIPPTACVLIAAVLALG